MTCINQAVPLRLFGWDAVVASSIEVLSARFFLKLLWLRTLSMLKLVFWFD